MMDDNEVKGQAIVDAIVSQRNEAMDRLAALQGEVQILRIKLTIAEEKLKKYESKPSSE